jgi:hypothetical protein
MKSFKYLFIIMFATAALVGCKKKADVDSGETSTPEVTDGINFDAMATDMCNCSSDLLGGMKKLKDLTAAGDTDGLTKLVAEMEPKTAEMEKCIAALEAKYPGIDGNPAYEAKAEAALAKNCPEYAAAMKGMGE